MNNVRAVGSLEKYFIWEPTISIWYPRSISTDSKVDSTDLKVDLDVV